MCCTPSNFVSNPNVIFQIHVTFFAFSEDELEAPGFVHSLIRLLLEASVAWLL